MWVFYLISLPLTVGMVISTPRYFAGPEVPHYVLLIVGYTWFCSLSVIILVPADIWAGFEDAGDFTMKERLKTSLHVNFIFYVVVGFIGLFGLILIIMMHKNWSGGILGLAMACTNTYGLVTGAFLLGFGLSEIPKSIWTNTDQTTRQKVLSHKIAKKAVKLDEAHQELSNAVVFMEDPSFKPQGGRLGKNDMDYDTDERSMATIRLHL